jgi:hypothetical protein
MDIAESWARRGKSLKELLQRFNEMFEVIQGKQTDTRLYKVEDITPHAQDDEKHHAPLKVMYYRWMVKRRVFDQWGIYKQWY